MPTNRHTATGTCEFGRAAHSGNRRVLQENSTRRSKIFGPGFRPRNVATRPGEGSHKSVRDHVLGHSDQRYSSRRQRQRAQRQLRASDNYIRRRRDERRCDAPDLIVRYAETSCDNDQVLTFNETVQTKLVKHCYDGWGVTGRRKEEPNTIGTTGILCAGCERPRCCTADQRNEFPPPHGPSRRPRTAIYHIVDEVRRLCASQQSGAFHFRFGSKADMPR
jgi:hypothetical protein